MSIDKASRETAHKITERHRGVHCEDELDAALIQSGKADLVEALRLCENVLAETKAEAEYGSWTSHISQKEIAALNAARTALSRHTPVEESKT